MSPSRLSLPGVRGPVYADHPLAPLTTWKIGGSASYLAVPQDVEDVCTLLRLAARRDWPVFFLGRGSNVLIADEGLPGLTLLLARSFQEIKLHGEVIRVGAGVSLPRLARILAAWRVAGYEFLAGIPGTVGAAVRLNAGAHGRQLGEGLRRVWVLTPELSLEIWPAAELHFGYRTSRLLALPRHLVVQVELALTEEASPDVIRARTQELLKARRASQPSHPYTCGSVFKNPPSGPPAGWLIDKAGWKGRSYGGAQVSGKHANFILNRGGATAAQVRRLMTEIAASVFAMFGISLAREVIFLPEDMVTPGSSCSPAGC
jgi:UDP-N-acetylmuramate dehydrogenase